MYARTASIAILLGTTWACSSPDPDRGTSTSAGSSTPRVGSATAQVPLDAVPLEASTPAPPECRIYDEFLKASHQRLADYNSEDPHREWARAKANGLMAPGEAEAATKPAALTIRDALVGGDFAAAARFVGPDGVCLQDRIGGQCKQLAASELAACGTSTAAQPWTTDLAASTSENLTCAEAVQRVLVPSPAFATASPAFNCFTVRDDADSMSVITADRGVEDVYVEFHAPAVGDAPWRSVWLMFSVSSGTPRLTAIARHARVTPAPPPAPASSDQQVPDDAVSAAAFLYNDGVDLMSPGFCRSLVDGNARCASASPHKLVSIRQLASLRTLLASPRAWSTAESRCVPRPHHGIELYDARGTRVGVIDICFECGTITSGTTTRTATRPTMQRLAALIKDIGFRRYLDRDP